MEFMLKIEAPALVDAINNLAVAIAGNIELILSSPKMGETVGIPEVVSIQAPIQAAPVQPAPVQPAPIQQTPVQQAPIQQAPVQQAPLQQVLTTVQTYTMEQLAVAATQLVDAQRRGELVTLLGEFGVQALTALPKEKYGEFATRLRALGARI